jgi:hypothetical protein
MTQHSCKAGATTDTHSKRQTASQLCSASGSMCSHRTGTQNNWPLEPEHHASSVEQSHPSLGGGQVQLFRWKRLEYTASGGIIEGWLGQELLWYQKTLDQAQSAIVQLQAQNADLQEKLAELQADALAQQNAALQAKIEQAVKVLS